MSRIRSIKPEFWTSPQIVSCSIQSRLLFIGLLCFCDDNGIHPASASRLRMEVFPEDNIADAAIRAVVAELIGAGLIAIYSVGDEVFWLITGWSRHQKIDKPTFRHPLPDGRTKAKLSDEDRRIIIEQSSELLAELNRRESSSRELDELTRRGSSGTESNGVESTLTPPSQGGGFLPPLPTTEYTQGETGEPKKSGRKFIAMAGRGE